MPFRVAGGRAAYAVILNAIFRFFSSHWNNRPDNYSFYLQAHVTYKKHVVNCMSKFNNLQEPIGVVI